MAIILASVATMQTTYTIIGIDFITSMYNGFSIVYAFKYSKNKNSRDVVLEKIDELVLAERIKTIVPITYVLCFLMGYYGPNAEVLCGFKLTLWHHQAIMDVGKALKTLGLLISIDFMSGVINCILFWTSCKINLFKVLQKLQAEYWLIFALLEARIMFEVYQYYLLDTHYSIVLTFSKTTEHTY